MNIVVTGSIAYDYLMSFPGKFTEHFLPEHMNRVSLSFLVDTMDKRRGGCAPNIAYTLALLGERPLLMATAGEDFGDYRQWLDAAGIDTTPRRSRSPASSARRSSAAPTPRTTRSRRSTPARWPTPASCRSAPVKDCGLAIIAPNDPGAMVQYAEECRTLGIPFIFDPGQQCARMEGDELRDGITGATIVIVNDYELELLAAEDRDERGRHPRRRQDADRDRAASTDRRSSRATGRWTCRRCAPARIVDPTGVGDAFRGGLMRGHLARPVATKSAREMGSVAATYALEHMGGLSHAYTWDEFKARYQEHFGPTDAPGVESR